MASTSVLAAIGAHCGPNDTVGGALDGTDGGQFRRNMTCFEHFPTVGNHATPAQIRSIVDVLWGRQLWDDYFKFTIVRNPWDRAVSWWDYATTRLGRDMTLAEACENDQRDYWLNSAGEPWADFAIRYEHLQDGMDTVCRRLSIPTTALPHLRPGTSNRDSYTAIHTENTRVDVAENFAREIELFQYRFKGG